jgi:hypothetical protein
VFVRQAKLFLLFFSAKGLYEYANSRLYKFGVPLHGDTKWTPPPVTAAPPLLVRVEVTGMLYQKFVADK